MKFSKAAVRRILLPTIVLLVFVLAVIWGSYFRQRSIDKEDAIKVAVEKNSNLVIALEQYCIRTLRNADAVLQMIRMQYRDDDKLNLKKLIGKSSPGNDIIDGAVIIDGNSNMKMGSICFTSILAPDFSNSPCFIFHSKSNSDSLLITQAIDLKRSRKKVIVLSRRVVDSKGKFAGVVAVQIRPSTFTTFYAQTKLLPNDIISLFSLSGVVYAQRKNGIEDTAENLDKTDLLRHVWNHTSNFFYAQNAISGIPTWFCYRRLKDYPIVAMIGSSEVDILSDFRHRQQQHILLWIIISVLVVMFAVLMCMLLLYRAKVLEDALEKEERYRRLLSEQIIAVQEEEREIISRELHDNINQVLATIKLYLETVSKQVVHPLIPRSMYLLDSSITEIRNLSHQLSAPTLGTGSLIDSINLLIENLGYSTDIQFEFDYKSYKECTPINHKLALYRMLQEQLNNIVKHARASKVRIVISQDNANVILTVTDNGKGFDLNTKRKGIGINNIMKRAEFFGGKVNIKTAPGQGCSCQAIIPANLSGGDDDKNLNLS